MSGRSKLLLIIFIAISILPFHFININAQDDFVEEEFIEEEFIEEEFIEEEFIEEEFIEDIYIKLNFLPNIFEPTKSTDSIGYINVVDSEGLPRFTPKDIVVKLESSDTNIASIPSSVIIKKDTHFTNFDVNIVGGAGTVKITSLFQGQTTETELKVGLSEGELPQNITPVINLPTDTSRVNTSIPFSIYIKSLDGTIIQAPRDIEIELEYDKDLLQIQNDLTIKKGDFYALGTIIIKENAGNAFIKATIKGTSTSSVSNMKIISINPDNLKVFVYPKMINAQSQTDFDIFVGLYDSDGNPAIATEDVKLSITQDRNVVLVKPMDDFLKGNNPVIKKGQFGYYGKVDSDFIFPSEHIANAVLAGDVVRDVIWPKAPLNYTISVSSDNYGISSTLLSIVEKITLELDRSNEESATANLVDLLAVNVFVPETMPPGISAIATYQTSAIVSKEDEEEEDDEDTTLVTIEDFADGDLFPVMPSESYSSKEDSAHPSVNNLKITTTDDVMIKIIETGSISKPSSFGTALIETGQKTGQVTLSVSLKGAGTGSATTTIINPIKPTDTLIFSPIGEKTLMFNDKGNTDILFVLLDDGGRPTTHENNIQYVLEPINAIINIKPGQTFVKAEINSDSFGRGDIFEDVIWLEDLNADGLQDPEETREAIKTHINTTPIGINEKEELKIAEDFEIKPVPATAQIILPFESMVTDANPKTERFGIVEIVDLYGNPVTVLRDTLVKLSSSNAEVIDVPPSITIPKDKSFAQIPFKISGEEGISTIMVNSTGSTFGSDAEIQIIQMLKRLSMFLPEAPDMNINEQYLLEFFVDDNYGESIEDAELTFIANDGTVTRESAMTDESGRAEVNFTPTGPAPTLDIIAFKDNYLNAEETLAFNVIVVEETRTFLGLPPWVLYAAIAGVAGSIGGVVFFIIRKPKIKPEAGEEEEI